MLVVTLKVAIPANKFPLITLLETMLLSELNCKCTPSRPLFVIEFA